MCACNKWAYQNMPLKKKKGRETNFMASVRSCLSEEVMSMSRIKIFPRKFRQYIFASHHVIQSTQAKSINNYSGSVISFVQLQSKAL
jgi:hypothetical protein